MNKDTPLKSALGMMVLLGIKGLGPATASKLVEAKRTLGDLVDAHPDDLKGLATAPIRAILTEDEPSVIEAYDRASEELDRVRELGAEILTPWDSHYPHLLKTAPDAPPILYMYGNPDATARAVACIGTRTPTPFGQAVSARLTEMLASEGFAIASGLARGVDSICHEVALQYQVPTVAVVASGLDVQGSAEGFELSARILDAGGAIFSEQPFGVPADARSLIRRNRIITGMSLATFFMQGQLDSGSMHSVRYALTQGRPVYAPGIPAKFADEELNRAAMLMARMKPAMFGRAINAKESLMEVLEAMEGDSVAREIRGRDSYASVLKEIEALEKSLAEPSPQAHASAI